MRNHYFIRLTLILLLILSLGCSDRKVPSEGATSLTQSVTEGVVRIAVMTDGTVFVNSETVSIDSLGSKLNALGDIKEVWYHREAPDAAEPHENAMKVIAEIADRKLPIAMYLDRDFKRRATFAQ